MTGHMGDESSFDAEVQSERIEGSNGAMLRKSDFQSVLVSVFGLKFCLQILGLGLREG